MVKKFLEVFMKTKQKEIKKYLKGDKTSYMSNEKDMIINLILGLMKKTLYENESILSTI